MSLLRHSTWAAAAAVLLAGSRFVFAAIIARRLSIEAFGQYAYGQWLADVSFLICSLGATGAIGRYVAEFRHNPDLLAACFQRWRPFALVLPLIAAVLAPLGAHLSGQLLGPTGFILLAVSAFAGSRWAMQTAALAGLQRFDLIFAANGSAALVLVIGGLFFPVGTMGPGFGFGLMAIASGFAAVVGYSETRRLGGHVRVELTPPQWRTIRNYAMNMWVTALLWSLVWSRGELPIVRGYLGDVGVARYSAVLTLFGGAIQGVMLTVSAVAPQLTRMWGEGSRAQAVALARKVMDIQLMACGVAAVLLILFSPELVVLAFGSGYRSASGELAVLSLGLLAMAVSSQNHLLQVATDGRFNRDTTLGGLVVLLMSSVLLVASAGLLGAALARTGTMLLMAAMSLIVVHRRWGLAGYSRANVAWVFLLVGACGALQAWMSDSPWYERAGFAMLSIVALIVTIRNVEGRMQALAILDRLRQARQPVPVVPGRTG